MRAGALARVDGARVVPRGRGRRRADAAVRRAARRARVGARAARRLLERRPRRRAERRRLGGRARGARARGARVQATLISPRGSPSENFTFLRKTSKIVNILCFLLFYTRC